MKLVFTNHALEVLGKRSISKILVKHAVSTPDFEIKTENRRLIVLKKFGNKFLKAIVAKSPNETIVITAHWLSVKRAERLRNEN